MHAKSSLGQPVRVGSDVGDGLIVHVRISAFAFLGTSRDAKAIAHEKHDVVRIVSPVAERRRPLFFAQNTRPEPCSWGIALPPFMSIRGKASSLAIAFA